MRRSALLLLLPLCACVTKLSHPTKTEAEMRADIDRCVEQAVADRPAKGLALDPLGELDDAHDCLEKLGYSKGQTQQATVAAHKALTVPASRNAAGQAPMRTPVPKASAQPCRVPCVKKPD
jgi:hypothetical protein